MCVCVVHACVHVSIYKFHAQVHLSQYFSYILHTFPSVLGDVDETCTVEFVDAVVKGNSATMNRMCLCHSHKRVVQLELRALGVVSMLSLTCSKLCHVTLLRKCLL